MAPGPRHACSAALDRTPDGAGAPRDRAPRRDPHVCAAATSVNAAISLPPVRLASRKLPRKGGSALIQVARSRAAEL